MEINRSIKDDKKSLIIIILFSLNILFVILGIYIFVATDIEGVQKFLQDNIFTIVVSIICSIIASCIFIIVTSKSDKQKNENLIKEITKM